MPYPINTSFLNTGVVPRKQAVLTPWDEWASTASYQGGASGVQGSADVFAPQSSGVETPLETSTSKTVANVLMATVLGVVGALAGGEVSWRNRPHSFANKIAEIKQFFNQIVQDSKLLKESNNGISREMQLEQSLGIIATFNELYATTTKKNESINVNQVFDIAAIKSMRTFKEHHNKTSEELLDVLRQYCLQLEKEIDPLRTVDFYLKSVSLSSEQIQYNLEASNVWQIINNLRPIVSASDLPKELKYAEEEFLPGSFAWLRKTTNCLKDIEVHHPPSKLVEESNKAKIVAGVTGFVVSTLSLLVLRVLNKPKQPTPKPTPLVHPVVPAPHLLRTHNSRASVNHSHKPKASDAPDNDDA